MAAGLSQGPRASSGARSPPYDCGATRLRPAYLRDLKAKTKRGLTGKSGGSERRLDRLRLQGRPVRKRNGLGRGEADSCGASSGNTPTAVSPRVLATTLNSEGVPGPGAAPGSTRRSAARSPAGPACSTTSFISDDRLETLHLRTAPDRDKRLARANTKETWEVSRDETLRIIDDALWQRVKVQQGKVRTVIGRDKGASRSTAPTAPSTSCPGSSSAAACGSSFAMRDGRYYGCSNYRPRGRATTV